MTIIASGAESRTLRTRSDGSMHVVWLGMAVAGLHRAAPSARPRICTWFFPKRAAGGSGHAFAMLNLDKTLPLELRAAALALLPMAFAAAGAWIDERTHLGFSNWRSACRASGLRVESLVAFTLDLLPTALIGALFGSVVLHVITAAMWFRAGGARMTLAAHGGCLLGMTVGLLLC